MRGDRQQQGVACPGSSLYLKGLDTRRDAFAESRCLWAGTEDIVEA